MQLQILDKDNKIIAWVDLKTGDIVHHNDYTVKTGISLSAKYLNKYNRDKAFI